MLKRNHLIMTLAIACLVIQSCGSSNISVPVTRPAEVNMAKFKKISVSEFEGPAGNTISYEMINALMESKKFEVLDRKNLDRILTEHGLTLDGLSRSGVSAQAGNLIGATALVSGNVSIHDYKEDVIAGESYKDKNKRTHYPYTRTGKVIVSVNFVITDLTSGKIIYSKNLEKSLSDSKSSVDTDPERIDKYRMLEQARKSILSDFMRKILPYNTYVSVKLFEDSDVPDYGKGIGYAKNGIWDKATESFKEGFRSTSDKEKQAKGMYNLGISYQYRYMFKEAVESFDKAYSLFSDEDYLAAMKKCREMEDEYIRVKEQTRD